MQRRTSATARIVASLALVGAVVALIVVISGTVGEDSSSGGGQRQSGSTAKQKAKPKTKAKTYVVKSGDTLTAISHKTGLSVPELEALNPDVDPQILIAGETLKLRR
jgi:LysM repeat protein